LPRRRDFSTNGRKKVVAIAGHRPKDRRDRRVDPTAGYAARPSRGPVPKSAKITRFLIGARNAVYHREPTKKIPYPGTRAGMPTEDPPKMKIVCDSCGAKYSIADEKVAGKVFKIRCK